MNHRRERRCHLQVTDSTQSSSLLIFWIIRWIETSMTTTSSSYCNTENNLNKFISPLSLKLRPTYWCSSVVWRSIISDVLRFRYLMSYFSWGIHTHKLRTTQFVKIKEVYLYQTVTLWKHWWLTQGWSVRKVMSRGWRKHSISAKI